MRTIDSYYLLNIKNGNNIIMFFLIIIIIKKKKKKKNYVCMNRVGPLNGVFIRDNIVKFT